MSKMNTPKMDVVRFKEADVVVASGAAVPQSMSVTGWGNGIIDDLVFNYGGTNYDNTKWSALKSVVEQNNQTINVHTSTGQNTTILKLYSLDHDGDTSNRSLTGLTWDPTNNRWNSQ